MKKGTGKGVSRELTVRIGKGQHKNLPFFAVVDDKMSLK